MSRRWYGLAVVPLAAVLAFTALHFVAGQPAASRVAGQRVATAIAGQRAATVIAGRRAPTPVASRRAATPAAATPAADGSPWRLVYSTDFPVDAPLGSFSGCKKSTLTCSGLPQALQGQWWAYPDGWPDTATEHHLRIGGFYSPSTTVWIADGMMNIRMWRGTGSDHSAAVLPKAAIDRTYGKYVETFRVIDPVAGYKSADMLHSLTTPTDGSAHEIDYPEGGWGGPFSAFVHYNNRRPFFPAHVSFNNTWVTTVIEWVPNGISFYVDGRMIGSITGSLVSDVPMHWILQNETQTNGMVYPPQRSSSTMQIKYVAYYSWVG
jgi:hypothetical protein